MKHLVISFFILLSSTQCNKQSPVDEGCDGCACAQDGTCAGGNICVSGVCRSPVNGTLGSPCLAGRTCSGELVCNPLNICDLPIAQDTHITPEPETQLDMPAECANGAPNYRFTNTKYELPLTVYVQTNGIDNALTAAEIATDIANTNRFYAPLNVEFRVISTQTYVASQILPRDRDSISVAYTYSLSACGEAVMGPVIGPYVIINADCIKNQNHIPTVTAHELGHVLGLEHPHGTPGIKIDPDLVEPLNSSCYSTARNQGDYLCDTPPDPGITWCSLNSSCEVACSSPNGYDFSDYVPNGRLIMSYYGDWCQTVNTGFTQEQKNTIRCIIDNHYSNMLPNTCSQADSSGSVTSPTNGSTQNGSFTVSGTANDADGIDAIGVSIDTLPDCIFRLEGLGGVAQRSFNIQIDPEKPGCQLAEGNHTLGVWVRDECDASTLISTLNFRYEKTSTGDCTSGICCDLETRLFKPSSEVCATNVESSYGCPWGEACGNSVGVRYRDQYCSGSASTCTGSLGAWKSWQVADNCSSAEVCILGQATCVSSAACSCSAAEYWNPTLATDTDTTGQTSSGTLNVSIRTEVRQAGSQLEVRACKEDGNFIYDVYFSIYDAATNSSCGKTISTWEAAGSGCTSWVGLNNDTNYTNGQTFGGTWQLVSPASSAGDWSGFGDCSVSGSPTGTCWSGISITLNRTCK